MISKRKLLIWSGCFIGIVFTVQAILLLLVSNYINSDPTQIMIRKIVKENLGEAVKYKNASLAVFPYPGLAFTVVDIKIPETASISMETAILYPELLPLLKGEIRLAKIKFEKPDITLDIVRKPKQETRAEPFPIAEAIAEIISARSFVKSFAPGLVFIVRHGKLVVRENKLDVFKANGVKASIAIVPKGLGISFRGDVGQWGRISAQGEFYRKEEGIEIKDLSVSTGRSSVSIYSAKLNLEDKSILDIESGEAALVLDDIYEKRSLLGSLYEPIRHVKKLRGKIKLVSLKILGPLLHPGEWIIDTSGRVENIDIDFSQLPGPMKIERGQFLVKSNTLTIKNFQTSIFDSSLAVSAIISWSAQTIDSADAVINGNIGPEMVAWFSKAFHLPPEQIVRAPLMISDAHIVWQKGSSLALAGTAAVENGPEVSIDLRKYGKELAIKKLIISDDDSHAGITLTYGGKILDFSFTGNLTEKTLNRMFVRTSFQHGWIKGDLRAHFQLDRPRESIALGHLDGANFIIPSGVNAPIKISHANLRADNKTLTLESAALSFGENHIDLKGNVKAAKDALWIDMDVSADLINVDNLQKTLAEEGDEQSEQSSENSLLQGVIRLKTKTVTWGRFAASPLRADILLNRKGVRAAITEASVCGISLPGNMTFTDGDINLDFKPVAVGAKLEPALNCLLDKDLRISGTADLTAAISARGKSDALVNSLQGKVELKAKKGCIYYFPLLAKILAFLNVTELLRGKVPDLNTEGLNYNSITIKGYLRDGIFVLQEALVDGTTMEIAGQGEIDFMGDKTNLTVLVAPFKTVDYLVDKIPLVGYVFKGTLISIPLRVTGPLDNPGIIVLSPTAVGQGLLGMMKRALNIPVKIIEPIIPRNRGH